MKKILCFMITLAIFMSGISVISYGAGEPDIKVSPRLINAGENEALVYDITCLYDLGTYNKNLKLAFYVTDSQRVSDSSLLAVTEVISDETGKVAVDISIDAPVSDTRTNPYTIYFKLKYPEKFIDMSHSRTVESLQSYSDVVNDIINGSDIENDIESNKLLLNLDTKYYDKLSDKSEIIAYLKANSANINFLNLTEYFDKASLFAYLHKGNVEEIPAMLSYYDEYLKLKETDYLNIYSTYENAKSEYKTEIIKRMQAKLYEDASKLKNDFYENIILGAVGVLGKTELDKVLSKNLDYAPVNNYTALSTTVKNNLLTAIKGANLKEINTVAKLVNFANAFVSGNNTIVPPVPGAPSGGGGGSVGVGKDETASDVPLPPKHPFSDISSHWAEELIVSLYEKGIINGKTSTTFEPDSLITREEFVKLIEVSFKLPVATEDIEFLDVSENSWYYPYIKNAVAVGLIKGIDEKSFGAGINIKREDIAVILARYDKVKDLELGNNLRQFADEREISSYSKDAVDKLSSLGVINGTPDGSFNPKKPATRAEVCKMLIKILELI